MVKQAILSSRIGAMSGRAEMIRTQSQILRQFHRKLTF
jgi:hypothetical protein